MTLKYTVEDFIKAYEETGLKPCNRSFVEFVNEQFECCPLSAMAVFKEEKEKRADLLQRLRRSIKMWPIFRPRLNLSDAEMHAFLMGVDGYCFDTNGEEEYFQLGKQVRVRLFNNKDTI